MPLAFTDFMWFSRLSARTMTGALSNRGKERLMTQNKEVKNCPASQRKSRAFLSLNLRPDQLQV